MVNIFLFTNNKNTISADIENAVLEVILSPKKIVKLDKITNVQTINFFFRLHAITINEKILNVAKPTIRS